MDGCVCRKLPERLVERDVASVTCSVVFPGDFRLKQGGELNMTCKLEAKLVQDQGACATRGSLGPVWFLSSVCDRGNSHALQRVRPYFGTLWGFLGALSPLVGGT